MSRLAWTLGLCSLIGLSACGAASLNTKDAGGTGGASNNDAASNGAGGGSAGGAGGAASGGAAGSASGGAGGSASGGAAGATLDAGADSGISADGAADASGCVASPAGLQARWRGEMNAKDDTGVFDGTAMGGVAYTTGRHGSAFLFDGVNDVVTADPLDYLYPPASMSAEAWIATRGAAGSIVEKYDCGGSDACSGSYWALYLQDGHPVFALRVNGSPTNVITVTGSLSLVNDGAWHHLVGVRDVPAAKLVLYVDGAMVASIPISGADLGAINNADAKPDVLTIGAGRQSGVDTFASFFTGAIDDLGFYTHAMTAAEVSALFNAPDGICP